MSTRWYKLSDTDLLAWLKNFSQKLSATPLLFHITAEQAGTMAGLVSVFENKLSIWREPTSNSSAASQAKQAARIAAVEGAKNLISAITTNPLTTDEQRTELGIPHKNHPTPVPVASTKPLIHVKQVSGSVATLTIRDSDNQDKRARPTGAMGANLFTFVGENAPTPDQWKFNGQVTRTKFELELGSTLPAATKVWVTACWYSARGKIGPMSDPIFTFTQAGGTTVQLGVMKMAA